MPLSLYVKSRILTIMRDQKASLHVACRERVVRCAGNRDRNGCYGHQANTQQFVIKLITGRANPMVETPTNFPDKVIDKENGTCIYLTQSNNSGHPNEEMNISAIMHGGNIVEEPTVQRYFDANKNVFMMSFIDMKNDKTNWSPANDGIVVLTNTSGHIVYALNMEPHYLKK